MRSFSFLAISALALGMVLPALSGAPPNVLDFSLTLTETALRARLGNPDHVRESAAFHLWDYNLGAADENDMGFAWTFYFDHPSGRLISLTHNLSQGQPPSELFPAASSSTFTGPAPAHLPVLVRELDGDRVLLGVGVSAPGQPCNQLIVMRRSALKRFYPWISSHLP